MLDILRARHFACALPLLSIAATACVPAQDDIAPVKNHESLRIESKILGETRTINVFVPPTYSSTEGSFPVLYMPDGGIQEDFPHVVSTVEGLIAEGAIPPTLVVGIENTERRRDLTGPTEVESDREIAPVVGGSAAFRKFLRDELVPLIESRYRCSATRGFVGESLAGYFIVETFLVEPELFTHYIAMSPSLWWNDGGLVKIAAELLSAEPGRFQGRTLWFTTANEENIGPYTDQLSGVLDSVAPPRLNWIYRPMKDEEHHTIYRAAKGPALREVFGELGSASG